MRSRLHYNRDYRAAALAATLGAFVAAPIVAADAATSSAPVTIDYMTWATGQSADWIKADWIAPFEATHPNIKVKYHAVSFGTFWNQLPTMMAAGESPDLIHMSVAYVYDYAQQGLIRDLQPWFDRDLDPSDYFMQPAAAERYPSASGDLYGIPFGFLETSLFYNKDLFSNAGVALPDAGWTWQTAADVAKKLTLDKNGDGKVDQYGINSYYNYYRIDPIIHDFGGTTISDDYSKVLLDQPAAEAGVQYMVDLIWKDHVAPPITHRAYFSQGNLGIDEGATTDVSTYRRYAKFDWGVALPPKGPAQRTTDVWPDSFSIPAAAKHPEAAWEFIKFVINRQQLDRYNGDRKIPFNKALATSSAWLEPNRKPDKRVFIQGVQYGQPLDFRPKWGVWSGKRNAELKLAFANKESVPQALHKAANEIRSVLGLPQQG